jgi:hypothetical protein
MNKRERRPEVDPAQSRAIIRHYFPSINLAAEYSGDARRGNAGAADTLAEGSLEGAVGFVIAEGVIILLHGNLVRPVKPPAQIHITASRAAKRKRAPLLADCGFVDRLFANGTLHHKRQ